MRGQWDSGRDPLAALREGDASLFEEFVRSEAGSFVGFFRRLGAARSEAEDLAQEVFLKLFRNAANYEPQQAFEAYALRVARNAWIDRRRRAAVRPATRSVHPEAEDDDGYELALRGSEPEPHARLDASEERERLERAVATLPELHRAAFELAVVQGLPYAEVAEVLDIPVGTVKSRVFHAVRRLREALERTEEPR